MTNVAVTCSIEGCEAAPYARGWCKSHYGRWQRTGSAVRAEKPVVAIADCSVEGCGKPVLARDLCHMHYERLRRTGDIGAAVPARNWKAPTERFWQHVYRGKPDACWLWQGYVKPNGYAQLRVDGTWVYAHRFAYALLKGEIPEGMTVDHECHNRDPACKDGGTCQHRRCCNPSHLGLLSQADNWRQSPNNGHSR